MNAATLLLFSALSLPQPTTAPAAAPTAPPATLEIAAPALSLDLPSEFGAAQGGNRRGGGDTPISWRGQAGLLFNSGDSGFMLGVGAGAFPFTNRRVEVTGDVNYAHISSTNGIYISGNGLYHFPTAEKVQPFAGAGLGFDHFDDNTDLSLQILGGLDFNQQGNYPLRVDVRFLFTSDTTTILTLGVKFGK